MMLFRSFAVGLLGACLLLVLLRPPRVVRPRRIEHDRELVAIAAAVPSRAPTIIDVAPGASASQIARLVRLAADERITAVDDRPVTGNLDAGTAIARPTGRTFIDLTIAGPDPGMQRRVLVLVH
jgi:hypothetical protein